MRFHVIQTLTGAIQVTQKVRASDKVLYTCPQEERAYMYAALLQGSRSYQGPEGHRAVNRRGVEITIPFNTSAN